MSSSFWFLKNGREYSSRISFMVNLMEEVHDELKSIEGTEAFLESLSKFIPKENHKLNNYGEYYDTLTGEPVRMNVDFRKFTPENQNLFWEAARSRLKKLIRKNSIKDRILIKELKIVLDMNKRSDHQQR